MQAIGLDVGTTSICGILTDINSGKIIKSITLENDSFIKSSNKWEKIQNPARILEKIYELLDDLYSQKVACIGVTGQMHGIVYVDKNANAISELYTWQDGRGEEIYLDITYAKYVNSFTGYGNVTHFYNKINNLVPKGATNFCTIHDYVVMKLCNLTKPLIHTSNAASLGLFNIEKNVFTIDEPLLPNCTTHFEIAGEYKNTPVCVAIGDNQASFLGAGCSEGCALVNIGTGSQVTLGVCRGITVDGLETRPLYDDKYLLVGAALCGGRAYALLENFFRDVVFMATGVDSGSLYKAMSEEIKSLDCTNLRFNNAFSGTRDNPHERGSIANISIDNFTPGNFILGVMTAIVSELFNMYKLSGIKAQKLMGSGNGLRKNTALLHLFEQQFNLNLNIPTQAEEACFGATISAVVASGKMNICDALKTVHYLDKSIIL